MTITVAKPVTVTAIVRGKKEINNKIYRQILISFVMSNEYCVNCA